MLLHKQTEKFIDLKELSKLLLLSDTRSTIKWCLKKNIEVQVIGKKQLVHSFLVDMELDKKLLSGLQKRHPLIWEDLYRCYIENDRIGYVKLIEYNNSHLNETFPSAVIAETDYAKAFANS